MPRVMLIDVPKTPGEPVSHLGVWVSAEVKEKCSMTELLTIMGTDSFAGEDDTYRLKVTGSYAELLDFAEEIRKRAIARGFDARIIMRKSKDLN